MFLCFWRNELRGYGLIWSVFWLLSVFYVFMLLAQ